MNSSVHPLESRRIYTPTREERMQHWLNKNREKFLSEIDHHVSKCIIRPVRKNMIHLFGADKIKISSPDGQQLVYEAVKDVAIKEGQTAETSL